MIPHEKTFIEQRITIPTPRFYMFYNGITNMEDTVTYRLSEMFSRPVGDPSIELVVTALNVNEGHNKEIMEACNALKGYSIFVSKVRKYNKEAIKEYDLTHKMPLKLLADKRKITKALVKSAINRAIDECIEEDVLRDFFIENRKEVVEMGAHEYSYEKHLQFEKEDSYNDGFSKGFNDGFNDGFSDGVDAGVQNTTELFLWLRNNGRQGDIMIALDDPDFLPAPLRPAYGESGLERTVYRLLVCLDPGDPVGTAGFFGRDGRGVSAGLHPLVRRHVPSG